MTDIARINYLGTVWFISGQYFSIGPICALLIYSSELVHYPWPQFQHIRCGRCQSHIGRELKNLPKSAKGRGGKRIRTLANEDVETWITWLLPLTVFCFMCRVESNDIVKPWGHRSHRARGHQTSVRVFQPNTAS